MATTCKLISKQTLGSAAAPVTFDNIPATYTDLLCVVSGRSANAVSTIGMWLRFNSDTNGANYSWRRLYGTGSATGSDTSGNAPMIIAGDSATADTFASVEIYIPNYAGSTNKSVSATGATENNATAAVIAATAGLWSNTAAITSVSFYVDSSQNFKSGSSFFLYGITKA
jgi:hypothetical protein